MCSYGTAFLWYSIEFLWYSVSCDLSAAPAPEQSAGPGTRLALTEKYRSIPALKSS